MDVEPARLELVAAPPGADLGIGGDEELHVRFGRDHGADVAAVENSAARLRGEAALALKQRLADQRISRDARGDPADRLALQIGVGEVDLGKIGRARGGEFALGIAAELEQVEGGGAVEQAGVHMGQAEMLSERAGDRCPCRWPRGHRPR